MNMQTCSLILSFILSATISFYTLSTGKIEGGNINFSSYAGKKVLIVNTAVNSADTAQYRKLELLYQKYKDSMVLIAIPSNSFGNCPGSNESIKTFIQNRYNVHYILGSKVDVKGTGISALYSWLADINKNGTLNSVVKADFYKYLIDKNGTLIGIFNEKSDPMGIALKRAIEQ
jgi:glutathione peroxidase